MIAMETQLQHILTTVSATTSTALQASSSIEPLTTTHPVSQFRGGGWGAKAYRLIHLDVKGNSCLRSLLEIVQTSGVTKAQLESLLSGVPGRRLADDLVDFYFRSVPIYTFNLLYTEAS